MFLPSADRLQKLGASSVSLVPSGRDRVTSMVTVSPRDTAREGRTILAADLGSLGTLGGPEALAGAESTVSVRTGN